VLFEVKWIIAPKSHNEHEEQIVQSSINSLIPSQKALTTQYVFDSCLVCPVPGNYYQQPNFRTVEKLRNWQSKYKEATQNFTDTSG